MEPLTPEEREHPIAPPPPLGTPVQQPGPSGRSGSRAPEDLACIACGYSLGGLDIHAKCPECGRDIEVSLEQGLLRFADPMWIDALHRSATTVAIGMGILAGASAVSTVAQFLGLTNILLLASLCTLLGFIAKWIGLWSVAAVNPALRAGDRKGPGPMVRKAILTQILGIGSAFPLIIIGVFTGSGPIVFLGLAGLVAGFVAWIVEIVGAMRLVRHLAMRVPDAKLADTAGQHSWLVPVLMTFGGLVIVGPLIGMVLYTSDFLTLRTGIDRARLIQQGAVPMPEQPQTMSREAA
jgi:hypothetical protein